MTVRIPPARTLLTVEYGVDGTFTSTDDTAGAALSTAFGGTFTIAQRNTAIIWLTIPYAYNTAADWLRFHLRVDGASVGRAMAFLYGANVGQSFLARARLTGLSAGPHTIAVQGSVGSGTGHLLANSTDLKAILTVEEEG